MGKTLIKMRVVHNDKFAQLSGDKKLSYNNLLDLDAAVKIAYG